MSVVAGKLVPASVQTARIASSISLSDRIGRYSPVLIVLADIERVKRSVSTPAVTFVDVLRRWHHARLLFVLDLIEHLLQLISAHTHRNHSVYTRCDKGHTTAHCLVNGIAAAPCFQLVVTHHF